jgi:LacI family transcriptional regulator
MTHRFPLKEIARQAGLGTATIDRVLNNRAHVSAQTKARVAAAITEVEGHEAQLAARGRRMFFDFVIEAPTRFSKEVRAATEQVAAGISTAVCRTRFTVQDVMTETEVITALHRIAKRGSQGVCLKTRDLPAIRAAVESLAALGIPVVTLVTDIQTDARMAYVGLDNQSAGRTAAYLIAQRLPDRHGTVLATRSNDRFLGEEDREAAFTHALAHLCPNLVVSALAGGSGLDFETAHLLAKSKDRLDDICAVYSMGGGNRTILQFLDHNRLRPDIYVAHDLDQDNRALIQDNHLNFVLHHDLHTDMRNVFATFLHHHKLRLDPPTNLISNVQVITPHNIPAKQHRSPIA